GFALTTIGAFGIHHLVTRRVSVRSLGWVLGMSCAILVIGAIALYDPAPTVVHRLELTAISGIAALGVCVSIRLGRGRIRPLAAGCCVMLVTAELLLLSPRDVYADRYESFTSSPYIAYLQEMNVDDAFRVYSGDDVLFPNIASSFDIDDVRAIDGMYPQRYIEYIRSFINDTITDRFTGS